MKRALIVGNGTSRNVLNLRELHKDHVIFGCNALYRDFDDHAIPDWLIAIDPHMIAEIRLSSFPQDRFIVPPPSEQWEPAECNPNRPRSNAGMNAMQAAIRKGHKELVCVGFDFLIGDRNKSISNLYDGTPNYGPETRANYMDNNGRANYLNWFALQNPGVQFTFAYPSGNSILRLFANNIQYMNFEQAFGNIHTNTTT